MQELMLFISGLVIGGMAAVYLVAILSANTREEEKLDAYREGYQKAMMMATICETSNQIRRW
jgi:hypothetical protein